MRSLGPEIRVWLNHVIRKQKWLPKSLLMWLLAPRAQRPVPSGANQCLPIEQLLRPSNVSAHGPQSRLGVILDRTSLPLCENLGGLLDERNQVACTTGRKNICQILNQAEGLWATFVETKFQCLRPDRLVNLSSR